MQNEVKTAGPLLDENGALTERGYSKTKIKDYDRSAVKAAGIRIKEWDYYLVINDGFALALTIADNSYMGLDSISLLDFSSGFQQTASPMQIATNGRKNLPASSDDDGSIYSGGKDWFIKFEKHGDVRQLSCSMDKFYKTPEGDYEAISADIKLTEPPAESMYIYTPYKEDAKAFYYNQKINCMRAEGTAQFMGKTYTFSPEASFGTLDWGRGVWTYKNTWYWGSASGLAGGVPFGFNIGYGFGDTSAASENMLFYNGKAHKLSQVTFNIPQKDGKDDYLSPWTFTSDDGRFEMTYKPVMDRASCTDALVIKSDQHQVFGRYSGRAVLDDGKVIEIKDLIGFAEKVYNKW